MQLTKQQIRVLSRAFDNAANLANAHAESVRRATLLFEKYFGEDVPEEAMSGYSSQREEAGSLVNNYLSYGENMVGNNTEDLIKKIIALMENEE